MFYETHNNPILGVLQEGNSRVRLFVHSFQRVNVEIEFILFERRVFTLVVCFSCSGNSYQQSAESSKELYLRTIQVRKCRFKELRELLLCDTSQAVLI